MYQSHRIFPNGLILLNHHTKYFPLYSTMISFVQKSCMNSENNTRVLISASLVPLFAYLLTAESVRMVAMGDLMFFKSHTFTVRSSLPETTLSPTVNTADVTVLETNTQTEAGSYDSEGNRYFFFLSQGEKRMHQSVRRDASF